ncbi:unnamed protein product [Caenorhabditis auriculariae]|uniref:G-protein coupled receptors family 1 profile domain-containing protein n=1 Tax=Caenorhabditis auriculariae TaxID=2777116 RepID=A0A8S1H2E8_9PELO|nr:unnamed protein product [Caenorhabditis auriculariae]
MNETDKVRLALEPTTSEMIEMFYQLSFFLIGTPINLFALFKSSRAVREGGVESRLVKLSRQLLIAHIMVLFIYGVWRSYWFYNIAWVQGDLLCKLFSFFCALPFHLWSNMVAAIAVDMLFCITSPLSSYRTGGNRVTWLIAIAWACAIICALPMLFIRGTVAISSNDDEQLEQCYSLIEVYSKDVLIAFNIFHVLTTFYVPLLIVIICYTIIGLSIRRQMAERKLLQVLALLLVVCEKNETCQEVTNRLNWLQAIIIARKPFHRPQNHAARGASHGTCDFFDRSQNIAACRSKHIPKSQAEPPDAQAHEKQRSLMWSLLETALVILKV